MIKVDSYSEHAVAEPCRPGGVPWVRSLEVNIAGGLIALLFLSALMGRPARAQRIRPDEWAPRFDEDWEERIPGPEIGDYLGIPINEAARLRGDSWDAALVELPENQCRAHGSDYGWRGPSQSEHLEGSRPGVAESDRVPHAPFGVRCGADDLDGWTAASAGLRAAHLGGIFHREMGRRHPGSHDDPPERELDAAKRIAAQRSGDGHAHTSCATETI